MHDVAHEFAGAEGYAKTISVSDEWGSLKLLQYFKSLIDRKKFPYIILTIEGV